MKLYELKAIVDMLNPEMEVVIAPPDPPKRQIGFAPPALEEVANTINDEKENVK